MSEISMYEAQKKKMQGLCDEHDLVYRFEKDRYGNLAGIPAVKAAGSLTTVLSSGLVAVIASRKAVKA